MTTWKVFYIYKVSDPLDKLTKTEVLKLVEESLKSGDPAKFLSVQFAKVEEADEGWGGSIRKALKMALTGK
jgi:hypothetical protein